MPILAWLKTSCTNEFVTFATRRMWVRQADIKYHVARNASSQLKTRPQPLLLEDVLRNATEMKNSPNFRSILKFYGNVETMKLCRQAFVVHHVDA